MAKVESPKASRRMGRPPGHPKSGGRQKGTPNKFSDPNYARMQKSAQRGRFDLLDDMIRIYHEEDDQDAKFKKGEKLLPYVAPRLAAVAVKAEIDSTQSDEAALSFFADALAQIRQNNEDERVKKLAVIEDE